MSTGGQTDAVPAPGESTRQERARTVGSTGTRTPRDICSVYGSAFVPPAPLDKVAVALGTLDRSPLNARRVSPERGACGWYVWGGEGAGRSPTPGFFQTLHVAHLIERCPQIVPFLALAPGWRVRIAADGPEVTPPHHVAPPANVAARRIGSKSSPPPSVKQWVWLSILLHILAVALFGDTTGGGARRGELRGERPGGPLNVTLRGPIERGVETPSTRGATPPSNPRRLETAMPGARATRASKHAAPAAMISPPPEVAPDATVMPPVIATEVDKPATNFVVPIAVPVTAPDPTDSPKPPEPEAPVASLPPTLPSLPRLNAIAPPKAIDAPTIERDVALPTELIPRLAPLAPARAQREIKVPETPRLKTFVPPRIEPDVVAAPIEMPRMMPLAPLAPSQLEREVVRPAELLPRLPPVTPAAAIESVTPAAQVPRLAQPVPPAPVAAERIAEPATLAPSAITPSTPPVHTSAPLAPSVTRIVPSVPGGAGAVQEAPAAAAAMPRASSPPATSNAPRIDLDAVRQRARELAREGSGPRTLLPFNVKPKEDNRTKEQQAFDKALKRPDCREAYADMGLAAVVPLLWDSVSEKGCKW